MHQDFDSTIVKNLKGKSTYNGYQRYDTGNLGIVTHSGVKSSSHHVQFFHLISDKCPEMLGFGLIFVHQIHNVSLSFRFI